MASGPGEQVVERGAASARRTPALSVLLGYGAMAPFALGAVAAWLLGPAGSGLAVALTTVWGGGILTFLAGVRRGLSFEAPGGATVAQIATTLWLFALGLGALATPRTTPALLLLLVGYASLGVLDPRAARRGEAPLFFARLRPVQMLIPVASVAALLALALTRP